MEKKLELSHIDNHDIMSSGKESENSTANIDLSTVDMLKMLKTDEIQAAQITQMKQRTSLHQLVMDHDKINKRQEADQVEQVKEL